MEIRIIGVGCARCRRAAREAEKAVALAGVEAAVFRSADVEELLAFRIATTPALIIDGALRSAGRVPHAREIASWLRPTAPGAAPLGAAHGEREEGSAAGRGAKPGARPIVSAQRARRALAAVAVASAVGLGLSIALGVLHFRANGGAGASFCAVNAELDCDAVALSPYSILLGAPIAAWGVLAYAALGALAASGLRRAPPHAGWPSGLLAGVSAASVAASAGLAWISEVRIGAFCLLCAACWTTNVVIAGFAWRAASAAGGAHRCLAEDLRALRRHPLCTIAWLVVLAGVAAAVGLLYPPYWMPTAW